ncbi:MAG: phage protease [Roseimicrobium sp.]
MKHRLVSLKAPAAPFDPAKGEAGLPSRFLVLPWGTNDTAKGPVILNATSLRELPKMARKMNWDRVVLDFDHNTVPGSPTYKGEPASIAANGLLELVEGEGLYFLATNYTPEGKQYAAGGHYGDLSPVVIVNEANEVIGCQSVALCRQGATPDVVFLSSPWPMKQESPPANAEDLLRALKDALNLGQEATPATVLQTLNTLMKTDESTTATKPAEPDVKALSATLAEQSETLKALAAEVKALRSDNEAAERAAIEAQCAREGKVIPLSAKDLPVAKLKALAAELPVTVPLEARTPHEGAVLLHSPTVTDDAISKLTGVTAEMRAKYKV